MLRIIFLCLLFGNNVHTFWFSQSVEYVPAVNESKRSKRSLFKLTNTHRKEFVEEHNRWRANVNPTAKGMKKMVWSSELEQAASTWAANCVWKHGNTRFPNTKFAVQGQNLYGRNFDIRSALNLWGNETKYYNFKANSCGKVCGHYTQVVWEESCLVGCGAASCPNIIRGHVVVCNYYPPGNVNKRRPYFDGASCTGCSPGKCKDNLCSIHKCSDHEVGCTIEDENNCLCGEREYVISGGMALNSYLQVISLALIKSFF